MYPSSSDRLVIRDYPILMWVIGAGFMAAGLFVAHRPGGLIFGVVAFLIGAVLALYLAPSLPSPATKCSAPSPSGSARCCAARSRRSRCTTSLRLDSTPTEPTITIANTAALSASCWSRLRQQIILEGAYTRLARLLRPAKEGAKAARVPRLAGFRGDHPGRHRGRAPAGRQPDDAAPAGRRVTDGVPWRVETITHGKSPVTRWLSPDFKLPGQFLYLTQKPKGSANTFGGLLGAMSNLAYRANAGRVRLRAGRHARPRHGGSPWRHPIRSSTSISMTLTNDPYTARQLLTPWVVSPLVQWAEQHPMARIQGSQAGPALSIGGALFSAGGIRGLLCRRLPGAHRRLGQLGCGVGARTRIIWRGELGREIEVRD